MQQFGAKVAVVATVGAMVCVNAVTMYVFLFRPFTWGDGTVARFMY
jgi:hypothetical protein